MKNKDEIFRFKKFNVHHSHSSMKVGVDGVFVGAWASPTVGRVVDVGCGCGVISLMIAQRMPTALVTAIDIHAPSVEEAMLNFEASPWKDRLRAQKISFRDYCEEMKSRGDKVDLIVSNPPYFDSGVKLLDDPRKLARHQGELSPEILIMQAGELLTENGKLVMVTPEDIYDKVLCACEVSEMRIVRVVKIRHHEGAPAKRILMEFEKNDRKVGVDVKPELEELIMFNGQGEPTPQYREMCGEFYLKF